MFLTLESSNLACVTFARLDRDHLPTSHIQFRVKRKSHSHSRRLGATELSGCLARCNLVWHHWIVRVHPFGEALQISYVSVPHNVGVFPAEKSFLQSLTIGPNSVARGTVSVHTVYAVFSVTRTHSSRTPGLLFGR